MRKIAKKDQEDDGSGSTDKEPVPEEDTTNGQNGGTDTEESSTKEKTETAKQPKKRAKSKGKKTEDDDNSTKRSRSIKKSYPNEDENEEDEEYEVEAVVDTKKVKGDIHYLIRWKGYSADNDTWEAEDTLSCPELINKFKEQQANGKVEDAKKSPAKRKSTTKKKAKKTPSPNKKLKTDFDYENADEDAEYEVEKVLEVHHKKDGKREFLIHWSGWSSKHDSWEPEEHLNCSDLIKKFMAKVEKARELEAPSLRVAPERTQRFTLQDQANGRRLSKRSGNRQRVRYDDAE